MTRHLVAAAALAVLLGGRIGAAPVFAHDELGFTGVIQRIAADGKTLTLKYRENGKDETVELTFTPKTAVTRDKKKVSKAVLVVGMRLKVGAVGCIGEEVDAHSIQILPPEKP